MLEKEISYVVYESLFPEIRNTLEILAKENNFSIYWWGEDNSGDIQVNIHNTWCIDLQNILDDVDLRDGYGVEELQDLIKLVENNLECNSFTYIAQ